MEAFLIFSNGSESPSSGLMEAYQRLITNNRCQSKCTLNRGLSSDYGQPPLDSIVMLGLNVDESGAASLDAHFRVMSIKA